MKKSFESEVEEAAKSAVEEVQMTAPKPAALDRSDALAEAAAGAGMEGEFSSSDIRIPYLQIVQPTSESEFPQGSIVFNKDFQLTDGIESLSITVLGLKKELVEDIPFESEETPRRWPTEAAAAKDGFYPVWGCDKYCKPEAQMTVLIPVDNDLATHFYKDQGYVRAMWVVKGSGYTGAGKVIITAALSGHLRKGIYHGSWGVTVEKKVNGNKKWFAPKLKSEGLHDADFIKWIEEDVLM